MSLPSAWLALGWPLAGMPSLTPGEQTRLAGLAHPHRRQQFLAARRLHAALQAQGAPGHHIGYSHSAEQAACVWAEVPVGVDLEAWPPRRPRDVAGLADALCTAPERAWLAAQPHPQRALLALWTAKEAAYKAQPAPVQQRAAPGLAWACTVAAADTYPAAWVWHLPQCTLALWVPQPVALRTDGVTLGAPDICWQVAIPPSVARQATHQRQ